ncbi:ribonuclease P protein component [Glaciecola punicea]|jgi:ribonuclease P protein component|uniref:ribonuclease P protein component n=1 Tax=Glaciecola punicea TaxID=56804 RepID=UPI00058F923A|nr:ribonuclease P protein component [Glaciecola punicea]OFA31047.1 ribonuclease P protein component [Glaciecola punicea]
MKAKHFSYPRESRLLTPRHFSHVFAQAIPAVSSTITLLARHNDLDYPRLGVTIPKKKVKLAVNRNRIKRCTRESFRLTAHNLPNVDIIVIGKHGINDLDNTELYIHLENLWRRITKRCK